MLENVIRIKNGIIDVWCMIDDDWSLMYVWVQNSKKHLVWKKKKKIHIWNPTTCGCENSKYVGRISGDSVITCEEL